MLADVDASTISRICAGQVKARPATIVKLSQALGTHQAHEGDVRRPLAGHPPGRGGRVTRPITWTPNAKEAVKRLGDGRLFATTTETAAVFGVGPITIRAACNAGEIPGVKVGLKWFVPVAWLRKAAGLPDTEVAGP